MEGVDRSPHPIDLPQYLPELLELLRMAPVLAEQHPEFQLRVGRERSPGLRQGHHQAEV